MKILAIILFVLFAAVFSVSAEALVLSKDGKTDYQIVTPAATPKGLWSANFLAWFLKEKTGAEFPVCSSGRMSRKKVSIFVGNSAPLHGIVGELPYKGMQDQEHIVRSVGKDILLYGKGYDADFYAISEFVDRCLGFRFYQRFVIPEIKKASVLTLKPFDYRLSWAFTYRWLSQEQFSIMSAEKRNAATG